MPDVFIILNNFVIINNYHFSLNIFSCGYYCFFRFSDTLPRMVDLSVLFTLYTPWFWFGIAIVCALIEGATLGLTTIWFAISAVLTIFVSLFRPPLYIQCGIFVLTALLLFFFTRPIALKLLHIRREKTNADNLIGKKAYVLQTITKWDKGLVKVNGTVWTAASRDGSDIPKKSECLIEKIEGVTLIVDADN